MITAPFSDQIKALQEAGTPIYEYEGNPYQLLHHGKLKPMAVLTRIASLTGFELPTEKDVEITNDVIANANGGSKWIDVVVYKPLYPCDFSICVREANEFNNLFKIRP